MDDFTAALRDFWPNLDENLYLEATRYRNILLDENQRQNLTRLTSVEDFVDSHLMDSRILLESGFLGAKNLDLGSGCGVPGLLAAILGNQKWILAESEGNKAGFLLRAVEDLHLNERVQVYSGRAEKWLARNKVDAIVCRAVGPVSRIWGWLRTCSTWNTLVLFKGPAWSDEWESFCETEGKKLKLKSEKVINYVSPIHQKTRKLVLLSRK